MNLISEWERDRLLASGASLRRAAAETGLSRGTVRRYASLAGIEVDAVRAMRSEAMPGRSNEDRARAAERRRVLVKERRRRARRTRKVIARVGL